MRWGFGWNQGPFEIWQAAGWNEVAGWINEDIGAGVSMSEEPLPDWVKQAGQSIDQGESRDINWGVHTPHGSYSPSLNISGHVPRCLSIGANCFPTAC